MPPKKTSSKGRLTFAMPIKVLVIEPRAEYCRTIWAGIAIGLSHILIGAAVASTLIYALHAKDVHAFLCTLGYQFFSAEAILSMNNLCGWATHMRPRHRKFSHITLQCCAVICIIAGTAIVLTDKGISKNVHGLTGLISLVLAVMTKIFGPFAWRRTKKICKLLHVALGIPTLIVSSICLCIGFVTEDFKNWAGTAAISILIAFVIFYTVCISIGAFMKFVTRV